MKILFLASVMFLTACASDPIIKTVIKTVEVPVPVPCKIKPVDKPDMPVDRVGREDELDVKTAAALAEIERRKAYEKELEAAIKDCQ